MSNQKDLDVDNDEKTSGNGDGKKTQEIDVITSCSAILDPVPDNVTSQATLEKGHNVDEDTPHESLKGGLELETKTYPKADPQFSSSSNPTNECPGADPRFSSSSNPMNGYRSVPFLQSQSDPTQSLSLYSNQRYFQYKHAFSYPNAYRHYLQETTPPIFQNMPLRRGKWTSEEETYANAIIEAFENGTLLGCENGCTLRAYLSRKLHCQPMRISKKYAGKSIGKQVFLSRLNVAPGKRITLDNNAEALKQLEFQFHMSLIHEGSSTAGTEIKATNNYQNCLRAYLSSWKGLEQQKDKKLEGFQKFALQNPIHGQSSTTSGVMGSYEDHNDAKAQDGCDTPISSVSSLNVSKMQQDLFNSLRQAQSSYHTRDGESYCLKHVDSKAIENGHNSSHVSDQRSSLTVLEADDPSLVDVNSGREKENWINETMALIPTLDPSKHDNGRSTPTYTSKSFDDLHQFIGNGLPGDDLEEKQPKSKYAEENILGPASNAANKLAKDFSQIIRTTVTHHQTVQFSNPISNASNVNANKLLRNFISDADEYAYLAQQSAIEASKHSAYLLDPFKATKPLPIEQNDTYNTSKASPVEWSMPKREQMEFSNANVKLHAKAQQQKGIILETHRISPSSDSPIASRFIAGSSYSIDAPLVSGSERSSSELGTEHSSGSCTNRSGNSGSDDNSDSTNDGRRKAYHSSGNGKRKSDVLQPHGNRKKIIQ